MKECKAQANLKRCNCTYDPCGRKGVCCECIDYHRGMGQLPACLFPDDVEKTFEKQHAQRRNMFM